MLAQTLQPIFWHIPIFGWVNKYLVMKTYFLIIFLVFSSFICNSQNKVNYASFANFMTEQTNKIEQLTTGKTVVEVKNMMGSSFILNIAETGKMKELNQLLKQPEFVNKYKNNPELIVDVLWYFSTPKDQNGFISKNECTPVIFENDILVGKGWPFFQTYRRTGKMR